MNANRHHHRRTLLAALAGAMLLAGVAHAAERPSGRPSATSADADSIQQAVIRSNARRRAAGSYQIAIADRNNADIRSYGRSADPGSAPADRNNAGLPQAETGAPYSTWDPFDTEVADRDHDWYPDAEMLDASLRLLSDPFGSGDDETDEPRDDDKVEDGSDRPACDPMDRDADGDVDFDDFKFLAAAFGTDEGDLDGDGIVTGADLGLMLIRISTATASAD